MRKLAVLASFAVAGSAFAMDTTMALKGRFDYQSVETKDNNGTTTAKDSSGELKPTYLRWAMKTKLNDTVSANMTLDFTDSADSVTNGVSDFVDTAYITKTLGNGLSLMVGKQGVLIGGRENDWSSRDMYTTSAFNDATLGSSTGLTLAYEVAGQSIYVQHLETNENVDMDTATDGIQGSTTDKKITGVAWYGSFMDGDYNKVAGGIFHNDLS